MKTEWKVRKTILFLSGIIFFLCNISIAQALDYEIIQITDNDQTSEFYMERYPAINNNGQITWMSCNGAYHYGNCVKMFFDGVNTIDLSSTTLDRFTKLDGTITYNVEDTINDDGAVVWSSYLLSDLYSIDIFLNNGSETTQLTDSGFNYSPVMNNNGQVAWTSFNWSNYSREMFFYDGTNTISLGGRDDGSPPQINDQGQVVWVYASRYVKRVMYYDGASIINLGSVSDGRPAINNNGQVAWGDNSNIYLYDGSTTDIIAAGKAISPLQINDQGHVAWLERSDWVPPYYHGRYSLFLYDGLTTTKIADSISSFMMGTVFDLNNQGHLAWIQNDSDGVSVALNVYIYDGTNITKLATQNYWESYPSLCVDMNDQDDVVWGFTDGNDGEIYLAKAASNTPPVFTPAPPQNVLEGDLLEFNVTATDSDGDNLTYSTGPLPEWASFDIDTGSFSWIPDNTQAGAYSLTVIATDDGIPAMSTEIQVDITVVDVPTAEELIDTTIYDLIVLDLPTQDMNTYMANLKKVKALMSEGKYNVAINQLAAFIQKVEQDMAHNDSIAADGQYFIDMANDLIDLVITL